MRDLRCCIPVCLSTCFGRMRLLWPARCLLLCLPAVVVLGNKRPFERRLAASQAAADAGGA